ncbi:MAG: 3-deoxy-manno-octulosonate cytidylyltransferase [Gemmatimonadaceae bacterium]
MPPAPLVTTLVVIPARLGAVRLPNKPLRLLGGVPLVVRVWERVREMGVGDQYVVATDSPAVADVVSAAGADVVLTSASHPSGTDRTAEVAAMRQYSACSIVVNVQGDEPFVDADAVRGAAALVTGGRFVLGTAAAVADPAVLVSPSVVKVVAADDARAMYFSRAPIPFLRDGEDIGLRDLRVWQHLGVYAYTRDALAAWVRLPPHPLERIERLEQLRPLAAGMAMGVAVIGGRPEAGIDTEEDLSRANAQWVHSLPERRDAK